MLALLLASLFSAPLSGEDPTPHLDEYTRRVWQAADGLPEPTVQAFAQTRDGFLWIGTTGGLLRFDGAHFTLFDHQNTPVLHENSIFCLMVAHDGALWIGTEGGGLARYADGQFRTWDTTNGISNDFVRVIAQAADGTIWAGTDNGLLRLHGSRFSRVDGVGELPALAVHSIFPDPNGDLWVGGSRLFCLHGNAAHEYILRGEASQNRVKTILKTTDGTVWVGTVSGLNRLRSGRRTFERVGDISATVRVLRQASDGVLWIGTIGHGVFTLRGGTLTRITAPGMLPSNTVLNFYEDSEHNFWIGTQTGMLRLTRTPMSVLPLPQTNDSDFGTVFEDRDGSLWIGSTRLFRMRGGIVTAETLPGLTNVHVRNVYRDRSGSLWVGTDGDGVYRISASGTAHYTTREGLSNNFVRAMVQDRDGSMWIANDEAINHIVGNGENAHIVRYEMSDGLVYFSTRALLEDHRGDLWIGTDRGLSHIHHGAFVHDAATAALAQAKIWAVHEDADGGLWFGTRDTGLFRYRDGKIARFTTNDGLASNAIYQILEDASGRFWMSGPSGVSLFNRSELDAQADSPRRHLAAIFYSVSEISGAVEIYGGTQPSGCITPEGDVWFPSNRGPIHIGLNRHSALPPPPVYFENALVDGSPVSTTAPLRLPAGAGRVALSYAPIRLRSQEGVRFRYRLEGFDRDWSAPTSARTAEYTNLPPGRYRFQVQAFDIDDPGSSAEAGINMVQAPHFYRTWWFLACSIAALALLIYALYAARVRQVRARFTAVLDERSRLAREMHDTVIQGCTSVSALLEAVSMEQESGHSGSGLMDYARSQIRTTIEEARDAIWNMRQPDSDVTALGTRIERMAVQISAEFNTSVRYAQSGLPFSVRQPIAHDLLMVAREAALNAVLHGKASRIDIQLDYARRELEIAITDNGNGFDPARIESQHGHHFGLKGMRERVQRSGGKFRLSAAPGKGAKVTARVPRAK